MVLAAASRSWFLIAAVPEGNVTPALSFFRCGGDWLLVGMVCFGVGEPSPGNRALGVLGDVFGGEGLRGEGRPSPLLAGRLGSGDEILRCAQNDRRGAQNDRAPGMAGWARGIRCGRNRFAEAGTELKIRFFPGGMDIMRIFAEKRNAMETNLEEPRIKYISRKAKGVYANILLDDWFKRTERASWSRCGDDPGQLLFFAPQHAISGGTSGRTAAGNI